MSGIPILVGHRIPLLWQNHDLVVEMFGRGGGRHPVLVVLLDDWEPQAIMAAERVNVGMVVLRKSGELQHFIPRRLPNTRRPVLSLVSKWAEPGCNFLDVWK